jgi:hypothetical protein
MAGKSAVDATVHLTELALGSTVIHVTKLTKVLPDRFKTVPERNNREKRLREGRNIRRQRSCGTLGRCRSIFARTLSPAKTL